MTLLLYSRKKGWPLDGVTVELSHQRMHAKDCEGCDEDDNALLDVISRRILLQGSLTEEQRSRLAIISRRCPVHRTLEGGPKIIDTVDVLG